MFLDDMTYRRALKYDGDPRALGYGRFLQPDPIGYDDGLNWYNYIGGDPVNGSDPSGLDHGSSQLPCASNETFVGFDHGGRAICNPYVIGPDIIATGPRQPPVVITGSLTVTPGPSSGYPAAIISYPSTTQKPQPMRSKPYVCNKLADNAYDVRKAWSAANADRKTQTNGTTNWNDPVLREGENWLTAASDYFTLPFARSTQIYAHQYLKTLPFSGSTPYSQDALNAGLDGLQHDGDTPEELKAWCNEK